MKANKYLLLWSSAATLVVLALAAFDENVTQEWRVLQREYRSRLEPPAAGEFAMQLRQVVVPSLGVVDRCPSCHVGMAPGEKGLPGDPVFSAHPDVGHDPANMGCVACHSGQGRATEKADAHGDVAFWPEPMIEPAYAYAGCGTCHTHLGVPNLEAFRRGIERLERYDCLACHRVDGRGGTLRPGAQGGFEGPDLSHVGVTGFRTDWYDTHLEQCGKVAEPAWCTAFGPIPEPDRAAIEAYLASCVGAPGLIEAKALFHSSGCRGCHAIDGVGGDDGPDLTRFGQKDPALLDFSGVPGEHTLPNWISAHFENPQRVVPGSQMPALGLSASDVERLTYYLMSLRGAGVPGRFWPQDRVRAEWLGEREFATDGATLYEAFCSACHGPGGEGMRYPGMAAFPAIGNPDFLAVASDRFIRVTIEKGRPGRRMPAWGELSGGLRPEEIDAVLAHLRKLGGVEGPSDHGPRRWVAGSAARGRRLYERYCAGCHGREGEGKEGPALANPRFQASATDTYLVETVQRGRRGTSMEGFAQASPVRPALDEADIESIITFVRTLESR